MIIRNEKLSLIILTTFLCPFAWIISYILIFGVNERTVDRFEVFDFVFIAIYIGLIVLIITRDFKKIYAARVQKRVQKSLESCNFIIPLQHEYANKTNAYNFKTVEPFRYQNDFMIFITNYQNELLYKIIPNFDAVNQCNVYDPYDNCVASIALNCNRYMCSECTVEIFDRAAFFRISFTAPFRTVRNLVENMTSMGFKDSYMEAVSTSIQIEGIPVTFRTVIKEKQAHQSKLLLSPDNEVLAGNEFSDESYGWLKNDVHDITLYSADNRLEMILVFVALDLARKYNDSRKSSD